MATWTTIFATSEHPTSNSNGQISYRRIIVWDSGNPAAYLDGNTGSTHPVTMNIPFQPVPNYFAPIEMVGTYAFPNGTQGQQFVVSGWLPSAENPANLLQIFQSGQMVVPILNTPNNVQVQGLHLAITSTSAMPFRWGGDFIWKISIGDAAPSTGIPSPTTTRLEFCWARADAPNGPVDVQIYYERTRVNLNGVYPINLFRYFLPNPLEYANIANIGEIGVFGPWYVDRCMQIIWKWPQIGNGPRYDNVRGASAYGVTTVGGNFRLAEWLRRIHATCNCYDLAGIVQLACAILVDQNGQELLNSNWIFQEPTGFINPGPLYGRLTEMDCNNPFWAGNNSPPNIPWNDARRTQFARHAWVEVSYGTGDRWVLDATHVTNPNPLPAPYQPVPESGTRSRADFVAASLDPRKDHGNAITKDGPDEMGADCWQNPNYQLPRIGVLSAGPVAFGTMIWPPVSVELRNEVANTVLRGRNPNPPAPARNAAPVNPDVLIPSITQGSIPMVWNSTALSIGTNRTRQVLSFNLAPSGGSARVESDPIASILEAEPSPREVILEKGSGSSASFTRVETSPSSGIPQTELSTGAGLADAEPDLSSGIPQTELSTGAGLADAEPDPSAVIPELDSGPSTSLTQEPASEDYIDSIVLTLEVFESPEACMDGLMNHIASFTNGPLSDIIQPSKEPLGAFSFEAINSVFWVRGDVFLQFTSSNTEAENGNIESLRSLAGQLDDTLAASTELIGTPGPTIVFTSAPPTKVKAGGEFTVKISANVRLLDNMEAWSDNTTIILPAGPGIADSELPSRTDSELPGSADRKFEFFSRQEGDTTVTIQVADFNTLRPASLAFSISVVE